MELLTKELDLKKILLQLYNVEKNMEKVLGRLKIKASNVTNFHIFDKDKDDPGGTLKKPGGQY